MSVSLPQHDDDTTARANQLAGARDTYRYAYDWPPGVATGGFLLPSRISNTIHV